MRNSDDQKPQYVDISYGWQERGDMVNLRQRRRRRWHFLFYAILGIPPVIYLIWKIL
jgi:hypothetical protein